MYFSISQDTWMNISLINFGASQLVFKAKSNKGNFLLILLYLIVCKFDFQHCVTNCYFFHILDFPHTSFLDWGRYVDYAILPPPPYFDCICILLIHLFCVCACACVSLCVCVWVCVSVCVLTSFFGILIILLSKVYSYAFNEVMSWSRIADACYHCGVVPRKAAEVRLLPRYKQGYPYESQSCFLCAFIHDH